MKLALGQRKYLKQFTHKCEENFKTKRYWEQDESESDDLHDSKKVTLDINELMKEEIMKLLNENITYDGIVESTKCESNEFHLNVDVENNDLQEGNESSSSSDEQCDVGEGNEPPKLNRSDLNDEQHEMLDKFQDEDMLCRLIKNLDEVDLTEDFLHLIDVLSTGEMENEN